MHVFTALGIEIAFMRLKSTLRLQLYLDYHMMNVT